MSKNCLTVFSGIFALENNLKDDAITTANEAKKGAINAAFWGIVMHVVLVPLGLVLGGVGAYAGASWYDVTNGFYMTGLVLLGIPVGGVLGFFTAQTILAGMIEDVVWGTGWSATKIGWRAARKKMKQDKDAT